MLLWQISMNACYYPSPIEVRINEARNVAVFCLNCGAHKAILLY
jgi:RNase P subunit RPR2